MELSLESRFCKNYGASIELSHTDSRDITDLGNLATCSHRRTFDFTKVTRFIYGHILFSIEKRDYSESLMGFEVGGQTLHRLGQNLSLIHI